MLSKLKDGVKSVEKPKSKKIKKLKLQRKVRQDVKYLIVLLRYGSNSDFSRRFLLYREIREVVNVKESTLRRIISDFKANGYQFE